MKVIVVASLAFSLVNFRGRLLADIAACGSVDEVIACAPDDDPATQRALAAMGIAYRRMPMARTGTNPIDDLRTLAWLIRLFRHERPGLVIAYTQKPIVYAGLACRITRVPRYFAMCSGLGHAFGDDASPTLRVVVANLYRQALRRAAGVFVFNGDDRGDMLRHRMISSRTRVIQVPGSGVDLAHYARASLPPRPLRFVMIARLLRSKGLFEYVEAARRVRSAHPDVRFTLVGPLDLNPAAVSAEQVARWAEEGVIDYLGEVRDVRPHLAAADVFVLPSWYREGLPRSILEAMAMGRAVVTTDMPGCREPIVEGVNGFLVPPRDADALTAVLLRFVEEPGLVATMGAAAHQTATQHFSVERVNLMLLDAMGLAPPPRASVPEPALERSAEIAA